jgi:LysR family transcriptional regulator (chromosome initiation inhibitor)
MRFEYPYLAALAAVVREGSFEAAARSLNITQSAVSQRIKHLEEKSGAVLIIRGRPCMPTEYGQQLCHHVEQVRLLEHDLKENLGSMDAPEGGAPAVIRIAVNSDSLATWFPEVIRRAGDELNLNFDVIPDDQEHTADRLRNGEALAAITTESRPLHGCQRIPLGAMEYQAVATPDFIEKHLSEGVTADTVAQACSLIFNRKDLLPQKWLLDAFGESVPLQGHLLPTFTGYLQCLLNGAGWGMMPSSTLRPYLKNGSLQELKPGTRVWVPLHWQAGTQGSEIMRVLSNMVLSVARRNLQQTPDL